MMAREKAELFSDGDRSSFSFLDLLGMRDFIPSSLLEHPPESTISSTSVEADPPKLNKSRSEKKGQKRKKGPRFAFRTKSEIDHLEDGYRWRKYGQKAVKNSPYPRSYYRCTCVTCGVKKRVERSCEDPSVVVTTYEGQHTHPCPVAPRGVMPEVAGLSFAPPPVQLNTFIGGYSYLPLDARHVYGLPSSSTSSPAYPTADNAPFLY
ncbi:probable WRKY transcription factor 57 [Dioscorea cayenensis subsp. rotundata]|uniref:Probable WRKY transcription factor 57 n=1 Tax=Dioscorea cayennensis subsp. rotundata TaxID=55577 RepID=A0AB40BN55_DIOCR|nr:probable WRKY transcription factor 57 [Dioscorea cayenensis subsp. rotundata]XP_039128813.1 probable WRKY transcription factor 57 [Dioscorea cayenensis subsp. rotundata]XP_039128814.1 probable WRKY transcription factor 57 [Dioscorea cayenensis subsp. rotundata]XP_039128815.1 probable WRKY transcription factor 57 [Dioscorea cayenensis subsp. rotundata]